MYHNLCPDTVGISGIGTEELIPLAARHGFGGIDFPVRAVGSVDQARKLAEQVKKAGLKWGQFWLPCDFLSVDEAGFDAGIRKLREIGPLVQAAGCTCAYNHIWPGSDQRNYQENFAWHLRRVQTVAGVLQGFGVRYGLEFLGPRHLRDKKYPFIHRVEQVAELADAAGAGVGVVLDSFHWYTSGGTLADVRKYLTGERIVIVHLNDARADRGREEQMDLERELPMATGVVDSRGLVRTLQDMGYEGPLIIEPFQPQLGRLKTMGVEDVLREISGCMGRIL